MEKIHKAIFDILLKNHAHDDLKVIIIKKDDYQESKDHNDGCRVLGISNVGIIHDYFSYEYGVVDWRDFKNYYLLIIHTDDDCDDTVVELIDCEQLENQTNKTI